VDQQQSRWRRIGSQILWAVGRMGRLTKETEGKLRMLLPEDQQLLSDQQLKDASDEQLQDLIPRLDLLLRSKGQPGLTLHPPEDERDTPEPSDPSDSGTIGSE
jgi:hypothetical protein